jgi:hypothetical protein
MTTEKEYSYEIQAFYCLGDQNLQTSHLGLVFANAQDLVQFDVSLFLVENPDRIPEIFDQSLPKGLNPN